ncbi:MAG: lysozyme inhibitor LprI family protein [Acetobacteraceae bacterium]
MTSFAFVVLLFTVSVMHPVLAAEQFDAIAEIARRSGLPEQEVAHRLLDCSANQQSMYFCAWRDLVVAEDKLKQRVSPVSQQSKDCADKTSAQLAAWFKKRDAICQRDAARAVGGGSDEPRQRVACEASMTDDYAQHFDEIAGCQ